MKLLSLFSGCGGMDIGFEGDFWCLKKSINYKLHSDWIQEELHPETNGTNSPVLNEGELTKAVLDLSVNTFAVEAQAETRASIPSNIPENETSEEKEVHNIWVFQYDAVTKELLIKPRYYTITDQIMLQDLPVYLKAGIPSFV